MPSRRRENEEAKHDRPQVVLACFTWAAREAERQCIVDEADALESIGETEVCECYLKREELDRYMSTPAGAISN